MRPYGLQRPPVNVKIPWMKTRTGGICEQPLVVCRKQGQTRQPGDDESLVKATLLAIQALVALRGCPLQLCRNFAASRPRITSRIVATQSARIGWAWRKHARVAEPTTAESVSQLPVYFSVCVHVCVACAGVLSCIAALKTSTSIGVRTLPVGR